jgi:hypothetical protein
MTKSNKRTEQLLKLMDEYNLNAPAVGRILGRTGQTVRSWRTASDRTIPDYLLRLLKHELARGNRGKDKTGATE